MQSKQIKAGIVVVALIALVSAIIVGYQHKKKIATAKPLVKQAISIKNQPTLGNKDNPIQIVAFEDLKCMMCRVFNVGLYPKIKKDYIDTGKASYTVINLAFIPGSINAAMTARCLYDQKPSYFFQFVSYLYRHQGPENKNWTTIANMLSDASKISGVDTIALGVCVSTEQNAGILNDNINYARKIMGSTIRTPSVYINGMLVDPLTMSHFKEIYALAASK